MINATDSHVRWTIVHQPNFMSTKILIAMLKFVFTKTDIFLAFLFAGTTTLQFCDLWIYQIQHFLKCVGGIQMLRDIKGPMVN